LCGLDGLFHSPSQFFRIIGVIKVFIGIYNPNSNTLWINSRDINAMEKCASSLVKVFTFYPKT
jgi:hypothetical protein